MLKLLGETNYSAKWLTSCSPIEWMEKCVLKRGYLQFYFFLLWRMMLESSIAVCTSHPWPLPLGFSGYYYRLLYELSDLTPREMKARLCYWHCYPLPQAKDSLFCSYITGPQQLGYLWRWGCCSLQNFYFSFKIKKNLQFDLESFCSFSFSF